jgi:hypothetical protein
MRGFRLLVYRSQHDYRKNHKGRMLEITIVTPFAQLRVLLPKLGLSFWNGNHKQLFRFNYPNIG